jgi:hypothetical protein
MILREKLKRKLKGKEFKRGNVTLFILEMEGPMA